MRGRVGGGVHVNLATLTKLTLADPPVSPTIPGEIINASTGVPYCSRPGHYSSSKRRNSNNCGVIFRMWP